MPYCQYHDERLRGDFVLHDIAGGPKRDHQFAAQRTARAGHLAKQERRCGQRGDGQLDGMNCPVGNIEVFNVLSALKQVSGRALASVLSIR